MEKFIKLFLLIVVLSTTALFVYANYDTISRGNDLGLKDWLIIISTLITSVLALPSIWFWFQLFIFNINFIFKDIDKSDSGFLKDFRRLALLSFIHSLFLLISISILLIEVIFNPAANFFSYFIIFLFLLLFIAVAGVNKITLNKIKSL